MPFPFNFIFVSRSYFKSIPVDFISLQKLANILRMRFVKLEWYKLGNKLETKKTVESEKKNKNFTNNNLKPIQLSGVR